jgi:hypothetical protein
METTDLCEPAVGGEDLVLLVHVHDLVQRHAELHDQRQAGILHRADSLRQFVLKGHAHDEPPRSAAGWSSPPGGQPAAICVKGTGSRRAPRSVAGWSSPPAGQPAAICVKGTGSCRTPRSAAGWTSPQGGQPAAICVKGKAHTELHDQRQAGVLHRPDACSN